MMILVIVMIIMMEAHVGYGVRSDSNDTNDNIHR